MGEMKEVYEHAQSLGQALADSPIFTRMQTAQAAVELSGVASACIAHYQTKRNELQQLMATAGATPEQIHAASEDLELAEKALNENDEVKELLEAQAAFQQMMKQVNALIGFYVGGSASGEGSCSGSCESCAGCH